jgi:DNA-binding transcriptional LysR family regulator
MNIAAVNLNLLVAFEALAEERSVSRAAARVGLTQPAMSNALKRLRAIFNDPLFVRTARGMTATPKAVDLAGPVRAGLAQFRSALAARPQFEPALSTRAFRLAMTDYSELLVLPALLTGIQAGAPGVQIVARRSERIFQAPEEELRDGSIDAAIGFYPEASALEPGTQSTGLFSEESVCVMREGHPLTGKRLTLRRFATAGHAAVISRTDARGFIDDLLAAHGLRRRLQAATPHFLVVPYIVASSDLVAVVPAGIAARFRHTLRLAVRKVPIAMPRFRMRLLWHADRTGDPAHEWLRGQIAACFDGSSTERLDGQH